MNGLSLRKKLLLGFTILIGVVIISSLHSIRSFRAMESYSSELIKVLMPSIENCNLMVDAMNGYKADLYRHVLSGQVDEMDKYEKDIKQTDELMKKSIKGYFDLVQNAPYKNEAERQKDVEDIKKIEVLWNKIYERTPEIIALSRAQKIDEALAVIKTSMVQLESLENDQLRPMLAFNEKVADEFLVSSESLYSSTIWFSNILIVVGIGVGVLTAFMIMRSIMNPVQELMRVFGLVAKGDLRERGVIAAKDELGTLINSYNDLLKNVGDLIKQIQNTADQVAASSEELTATADQSSQVTDQIANAFHHVADLSKKEVKAVNEAGRVIEQISAGLEESASTVVMTADHAKKALYTAQEGREIIRGAVVQMENIERTVNRSADVVTKLGDRSKEIGQIVDTIAGIAGQTNLLALNAAIEAARAGEQGKGFAVVAEEVRKLAEQSQEAAKQIGGLISGIQVDTEQAVVAMNEGTVEVRTGTEVVNKAGSAFGELLGMIDEVNRQSDDMARTTEELAMGIQNVVESIQSIDTASKEVSSEAGQVSAATEEQSAAMEQIAASSRSLADLAQNLQSVARRFNV